MAVIVIMLQLVTSEVMLVVVIDAVGCVDTGVGVGATLIIVLGVLRYGW
jgi:hypothetical protein